MRIRLAAFKQKPPRGGRPARLRRRTVTILSCVGDKVFNVEIVLGERACLLRRRRRRGATMTRYEKRYPIAAGVETVEIASIHPI